jgi:septal ring factor EnvC (AmiA/AmiB activator)
MEPKVETNGGTAAPPAGDPIVVVSQGSGPVVATPPVSTMEVPRDIDAPAETRAPKPTTGFFRRLGVGWMAASVAFVAVAALTVMLIGQRGQLAETRSTLAGARTDLAGERAASSDLRAQIAGLTGDRAALQDHVDQLTHEQESLTEDNQAIGSELSTCAGAVRSMDGLIHALLDALTAPNESQFMKAAARADRLARPASEAKTRCLSQADVRPTSL